MLSYYYKYSICTLFYHHYFTIIPIKHTHARTHTRTISDLLQYKLNFFVCIIYSASHG